MTVHAAQCLDSIGAVVIEGADRAWANLYEAKTNPSTIWPEGFDSKAAGVTFV